MFSAFRLLTGQTTALPAQLPTNPAVNTAAESAPASGISPSAGNPRLTPLQMEQKLTDALKNLSRHKKPSIIERTPYAEQMIGMKILIESRGQAANSCSHALVRLQDVLKDLPLTDPDYRESRDLLMNWMAITVGDLASPSGKSKAFALMSPYLDLKPEQLHHRAASAMNANFSPASTDGYVLSHHVRAQVMMDLMRSGFLSDKPGEPVNIAYQIVNDKEVFPENERNRLMIALDEVAHSHNAPVNHEIQLS